MGIILGDQPHEIKAVFAGRLHWSGTAATMSIGQALRTGEGGREVSFPNVFRNESVDPSFGGTSRIYLDELTRSGATINSRAIAPSPSHAAVMRVPQSRPMSHRFASAALKLRQFLATGRFSLSGAVMTDLDGTAVLEREGTIYLPQEVENGLKRIHAHGRPVIANTLRFPLSVMRVFGHEWHRATGTDLPLVSLKGAQVGRVYRDADGVANFEEWHSEPLDAAEIDAVISAVEGMVSDGVEELLVFHYARDWRLGEQIWTPVADRIDDIRNKYRSASSVQSSSIAALRDALHAAPICMIFLLVDLPNDRLMAYQHTQRSSFFTHHGVSKRSGADRIAARLNIDLSASIGAGDASPDDFLEATGFSIIVGGGAVDYKGLVDTVRVDSVTDLGRLLHLIEARLD